MTVLCRLGIHRWSKLGTTTWLAEPSPFENRLGIAMEYRRCSRCAAIRDVTTFPSAMDDYYPIPRDIGPIAAARIREIMGSPRKPLPAPPLRLQ